MKRQIFVLILTVCLKTQQTLFLNDKEEFFYGRYLLKDPLRRVNFLPSSQNQNFPIPCSSSFAFAIALTMSVQINLASKGLNQEILISPQMLINCLPEDIPFSCEDDTAQIDIVKVLTHLKKFPISDESCNQYKSSDKKECSKKNQCKRCYNLPKSEENSENCVSVDYRGYTIEDFDKITSTLTDQDRIKDLIGKMKDKLKNVGPLLCLFKHSDKIFKIRYRGVGQLFVDEGVKTYKSWVGVTGFGTDETGEKVKFAFQTSFGENVGLNGMFFLNQVGLIDSEVIENCYFAKVNLNPVLVPNASQSKSKLIQKKVIKKIVQKNSHFESFLEKVRKNKNQAEVPIDWRYFKDFPRMTRVVNLQNEDVCDLSWNLALTSTIADILLTKRIDDKNHYPKLFFSVQSLINCRIGGSCNGGDIYSLIEKVKSWKIPVENCQPYIGKNLNPDQKCKETDICQLNWRKAEKPEIFSSFNGIRVINYGRVRGITQIKSRLVIGPVVCKMHASPALKNYKKREDRLVLFDTDSDYNTLNHSVTIAGWGTIDKKNYWIVRNSWGREWGYDGYFYIKAGENLLGIESDCIWIEVEQQDFSAVKSTEM